MRKQIIFKIERAQLWEIMAFIVFYCFLMWIMTEEKVILVSGVSWLLCFVLMGINKYRCFWEFSSALHDHLRVCALVSGVFFFTVFNYFP